MDHSNMKELSMEDIQNFLLDKNPEKTIPVQIVKSYDKQLRTNLLIPSVYQNYSCAIEFMTNWFYSKFPANFFQTKYIESSTILEQAIHWRKRDFLRIAKPAAVIRANVDTSFNRENLDLYEFGTLLYANRATYNNAFFADYDKHTYVAMAMEMLLINFTFKMVVLGQGLQHDLAKECQMVFRAGATQKHYVDMDFHIPKELVQQLAADAGMKVCPCSGRILDDIEFCSYFNKRSILQLMFKFNAGTGNYQYYLKVPSCLIHIKTEPVQQDDGNREGHVMVDYSVSFDCQVRFPAPKFYAYYSYKKYENVRSITPLDQKSFIVANTSLARVAKTNSKGWDWFTRTEYNFDAAEEQRILAGELMHIDFAELIGNLRDVIDITKSMAISPDVFLDIQVFSGFKIAASQVDWQNYRINLLEPIQSSRCYLIIYIDKEYYHTATANYLEYDKARIQLTKTNIEHKRLDYSANLKRASFDRIKDKVQDTSERLGSTSKECLYLKNKQ